MAEIIYTLSRHNRDVNGCCFSANSRVLASCSGDKTSRLWDIESGEELPQSPLERHDYQVNSCCFSPFGTILATASSDCKVILWDVNTGECLAVLEGHRGGVRTCSFSPNSQFLISGSADETFCIWDVSTRKLVRCVDKIESTVNACVFTPDGLQVVIGTSNGNLSIFDVHKGNLLKYLGDAHDLGVTACSFSPTFGSADHDYTESQSGICISASDLIPTSDSGSQPINTSGCAPQFLLATAGNDNLVRLWNIFTSSAYSEDCHIDARCVLDGHQGPVLDCKFSANGRILASASNDKTVILWDPLRAVTLHTITGHTRYVTCCAFSPDSRWLATGSGDRTMRVWQITLTERGDLDTNAIILERKDDSQTMPLEKPKKKLLALWTVDEVCSWLETIGLEQYGECFRENAIDGAELSNMTSEMLLNDIKIGPVGHRNKILRSINDIKKEEIDDNIPDEYLCPISREVMTDPVIAADGYSYDRNAIELWLRSGRLTSPMTNAPLRNATLTPNRMLKNIINRHFGQANQPLA
ncbi:WD repeat, SAM and U-box domain-containing protein 1-like isoform X2 [Actinia tenebrosa]|uniref:WD repeat, SAM and U-box domain-containing protein 1 n=1 Tax=Actinia tenebrosa TaxID=6105 RepID=A0A6P8J0Z6_ACTTE|nr:WD repeat, SAM and U-box domain-containing protein 1-like isoform X2 [Actinia tenebrosa]